MNYVQDKNEESIALILNGFLKRPISVSKNRMWDIFLKNLL